MSTAPHRGMALALLASTQFVLILDASIVGIALPSIGPDLDFRPEDLSWVANAYTLTFGGFLLLGGRVADLVGRRRMFMVGLVLFAAASLAGSLAQTPAWLVGARAVQGLGAALVAPAALALVMTIFDPGPDRNKALGVFGAVAGVGGAAGQILGGVLTEWLGWQSTLYVNVPIGILVMALAPRLLPEARDTRARGFDLAGAVSVTAGLALLVYALVDANEAGWASGQTLGLGVLAFVLIAAFIVIEARSANPLMPLGIFRSRTLRGANIIAVLMTTAMFPMFYFLTFYLQQVLSYSPLKAGFGGLPIAVMIVISAGVSSSLVTKLGFKIPTVVGLVVLAAGMAWFAQMSPTGGGYLADIIGPSIVMGLGGGVVFVASTVAATAGARQDEAGLASGIINTAQQVGGALGLAALVAAATHRTEDAVAAGGRMPAVLAEGYQDAMLIGTGILVAAALLSIVLLPGGAPQHADDEDLEAVTA